MIRRMIPLGIAFFLLEASAALAQTTAQGFLDKGAEAFNRGDHAAAVQAFQSAVNLAPTDVNAHLHLAHAYLQQVGLKAGFEENMRLAGESARSYHAALVRDRMNANAMLGLARASYLMGNIEEARLWCRKAIEAEPKNKDTYFALGFLDFAKINRKGLPIQPVTGAGATDPAPIRDAQTRYRLRYELLPAIEEGIQMITKALALDPNYDRALAYLGLLIQKKAELADSAAEYQTVRAQAAQHLGRSKEAQGTAGAPAAIKLDPRQPPPLPSLAPAPPPQAIGP